MLECVDRTVSAFRPSRVERPRVCWCAPLRAGFYSLPPVPAAALPASITAAAWLDCSVRGVHLTMAPRRRNQETKMSVAALGLAL